MSSENSKVTVTKSERLLMIQPQSYRSVGEVNFVGERTVISIDQDTWVDMGEPQELTVTILPGDHLNPSDLEEG